MKKILLIILLILSSFFLSNCKKKTVMMIDSYVLYNVIDKGNVEVSANYYIATKDDDNIYTFHFYKYNVDTCVAQYRTKTFKVKEKYAEVEVKKY